MQSGGFRALIEFKIDSGNTPRDDAIASSPEAAQPQAMRPVDVVDILSDPSAILQGSQMLGRASWSAGRMAVADGPIAQYVKAKAEKDARAAEEARQLEQLEAWGREKTSVGGVEMTNGEAQEARQRVIDSDEAYAQWAVKTGRIREDEKDEFKAAIRRKKELEDKRGRGTLTEAEAAEAEKLKRSRPGQAADAATAEDFWQKQRCFDTRINRHDANDLLRRDGIATTPSSGDQSPFQDLQAASAANTVKPVSKSEKVLGTGLDL